MIMIRPAFFIFIFRLAFDKKQEMPQVSPEETGLQKWVTACTPSYQVNKKSGIL